MGKLLQRIATALVLLALLIVVMFVLPPTAATGVLCAFAAAAGWEWAAFFGATSRSSRAVYAGLVVTLVLAGLWAVPDRLSLGPVVTLALAWWLVAAVLVVRYPVRLGAAPTALAGLVLIVPAWIALDVLLRAPGVGPKLVLYLLGIVWAADIGAYFTGRRVGRVRLAPRLSPGKTWEGVAGGVAAAALIAATGAAVLGLPVPLMVAGGLVIALVSIVGDLTVSLFKRNAGLKDSGHLFPGHGGVLDRVDSITPAVALFAVQVAWLGLLDR